MLLRFVAQNHLSLRDRVELSMVASGLRDRDDGLIQNKVISDYNLVPSAIIYGPNASGKSNVVAALRRMCSFVLHSHLQNRPDSGILHFPFLLDDTHTNLPTLFEVDFISDEVRYIYGFEYTSESFTGEWLYAYPLGRPQMLFRREGQSFKFGRNLRGRNQTIADLTRNNSLFISAAAQNDHKELSSIYRFFSRIEFQSSIVVSGHIASSQFESGDVDGRVINFLRNIGSGVVGFRRREEDVTDQMREFQKGISSLLQKVSGESFPEKTLLPEKHISIELAHLSKDGSKVFFDLDRESSGTRRLLVLLTAIFKILDNGGLVVVDELDASLHTHICEAVLSIFSSQELNPKGAQIVATTHDTNILSAAFLRRDQIWFCEKAEDGHTELFPLTDIHLRATDNIERGYLQGRFGALPFRGSGERFVNFGGLE